MLGNFTIRQRLVALSLLASLALATVAAVGYIALTRSVAAVDAIITRDKQVELLAQSSLTALLNVRRYEKDLLINIGHPAKQEDYFKKWQAAITANARIYGDIAATLPAYADASSSLKKILAEYEAVASKVIGDSMAGRYTDTGEANDAITLVAKVLIHQLEDQARSVAKKASEDAAAERDEAAADAATASLAMAGVALAAVVLTIAGSGIIATGIVRSLHEAGERIGRLAADRDLTVRFSTEGRDEVAAIGRSLNSMALALKAMFEDIAAASGDIRHMSHQVSASAVQLKSAAGNQADAVNRMAGATEQVSASIDSISSQSCEIVTQAASNVRIVHDGEAAIARTAQTMLVLSGALSSSADEVRKLSEESEEIDRIIQTIKDIADQTNLLALNAAIESARAGEQGRGFAVVANEVRKLAEKTTSSTGEISSLVLKIRSGITGVSDGIIGAVAEMQRAQTGAGEACQALDHAKAASTAFNQLAADISSATSEQSTTTRGVAHDVEGLAQMAEETGSVAHALADTAAELRTRIDLLGDKLSLFKV